ncbi:MAG: leucine-rich repeat domain-containing protein [Eubacterium sp.]|nr:leucine-rich repeat domain-containing protein [Eubacterium sp.]
MKKTRRRIISAIFALALLFTSLIPVDMSVVFAATSGSCGTNATWSYNTTTKTLTISGTGATKDYRDTTNKLLGTEKAPWIEYKSLIENVVVESGITEIGDYAFFECTALTSVSLPTTLTKLDGWGGAVGNVDKTYGCFQSCTALQSIELPGSLTEIEPYVFNGCSALKNIVIPNNVTTIGKYAFFDCSALERVTFGVSLTSLGENAFRNAGVKRVNWNDNLTSLPTGAFFNCGFVEISIPETITSIGQQAFKNNTFLRTITVNNANTTFNGNVCEGSNQSITVRGHSSSTAQAFAEQYEYAFESLDACAHTNTHTVRSKEPTCDEEGIDQVICDDCGEVVRELPVDALGHEWGDPVETVDETTKNGHVFNAYVCSVCGATKEEVVHQLAANIDLENLSSGGVTLDPSVIDGTVYVWIPGYYSSTVIRNATCTETGLERYHCTVDGCDKTETHIVRAHHTVTNWTVTKAPTCTEEGTRTGRCDNCGENVTETVATTGHSYDMDNPDEIWDEEADGHTHKLYICQNCGEQIEEYVHNEWIDGYYTPMSTSYDNCQLPGVELDTCDLCGARRTVEIPARGDHDYYETSRTEPNCTQRGRIYLACHNCSFTTVQYIDALGHDFQIDDENTTAATCTQSGTNFYRCSRCSASKSETVAALGHQPQEGTWVVDTQPTCTKTGTGRGYCERCEQSYTATIDALGHDYEAIETDLTDEGKPGHVLSVNQCTRCNARETGEVVHKDWTEGNYTVTATTPATCTVGSNEIRQCTICNTIKTVEVEPALGHRWAYTGSFSSSVLTNSEAIGNISLPTLPNGSSIQIPDVNSDPVEVPFTGEVTAEGVEFRCIHCARTTVKSMDEIKALWTFDVLNTEPQRSAPVTYNEGEENEETVETNLTSYLDMNCDGIINGKDYAYIKQLYAQQKELEAQQPEQSESE